MSQKSRGVLQPSHVNCLSAPGGGGGGGDAVGFLLLGPNRVLKNVIIPETNV